MWFSFLFITFMIWLELSEMTIEAHFTAQPLIHVYYRKHVQHMLRAIALTCAHFGRDQICTQVKASFSTFGHPTQVKVSWVTSINLLLAIEIEDSLA